MRNKIVSWFQQEYPDICKAMMDTNHTYEHTNPNKFHAEGTVWTHTMMVMTWIEAAVFSIKKEVLMLTALLHDIGKPDAKEFVPADGIRPDRYRFNGHEGLSAMKAIEVLQRYQSHHQLSDQDLKDVLYLISTHGSAIPGSCYLETYRRVFRQADKSGAIRRVDERNPSLQYQPHKYAKRQPVHGKELIILTGLPCSGKSTYKESLEGYTLISRDNLIMQLATDGLDYNQAYEEVHANGREFLDKEFDKMVNAAIKSDKVVIDMTMMSLGARRSMLNRFNKHVAYSKVFLTNLTVINERNNNRAGKHIPDYVLHNMSTSFLIPTVEEGFEDVELLIT